jgi:hypothetical protein
MVSCVRRGTFVDVFVASGRYSHIGLGVGHVGIIVGTHNAFLFCENPFVGARACVGASHPHGKIKKFNLMLSLEGVPKLTH